MQIIQYEWAAIVGFFFNLPFKEAVKYTEIGPKSKPHLDPVTQSAWVLRYAR